MLRPLICRYAVGMTYGDHVDAAIMGEAPEHLRCDIAITICLNDAADYDGGELVIDTAGVPRSWKGRAGDAIVYPADTLLTGLRRSRAARATSRCRGSRAWCASPRSAGSCSTSIDAGRARRVGRAAARRPRRFAGVTST